VIDRIHIEQLSFHARIGVSEAERAKPQRLAANVTFWPDRRADLNDLIGNAVDYAAVAQSAREFVAGTEFGLIETLADKLAAHLLAQFGVSRVTVEVRKFVLPDTKFVSVTATQESAEG
jgi:7,8-dihydroneopterin aldolase/epimerase/oxygenase